MTEKLKVSREVADAIEYIKTLNSINEILINHAIADDAWIRKAEAVNNLSIGELATALIVGYEVEMTPHEEIAKEYKYAEQEKDACFDASDENLAYENQGIMSGIKFTLNKLGITIEGVNDI